MQATHCKTDDGSNFAKIKDLCPVTCGTCVADAQNDDDDSNGCDTDTTTAESTADQGSDDGGDGDDGDDGDGTTVVTATTTTTTTVENKCAYALEIYNGIVTNCPAQCSADGSNKALRRCDRDEFEMRTPDTCGEKVAGNKCGDFFGSLTSDMFDVFWYGTPTPQAFIIPREGNDGAAWPSRNGAPQHSAPPTPLFWFGTASYLVYADNRARFRYNGVTGKACRRAQTKLTTCSSTQRGLPKGTNNTLSFNSTQSLRTAG